MQSIPAWLWALLAMALVLYTDDYVVAGVLPEIAADLDVTEAQAGQLVTVFSLTVAVLAPVAGVLLTRVERRRLFVLALTLFVVANALVTVVDGFAMVMVLRVLAAGAAAAATPAAFAYAAEMAPEGRTGRYVAVVALGVTGSVALGVPLGTWIGGAFGWRATFGSMAAAGVVVIAVLLLTVRSEDRRDAEVPALAEQLRILGTGAVSLGLTANMVLMTGSLMMLTYLAPFLTGATGAGVDARAVSFGLAGVAGVLGILGGGAATDRWGADRTLIVGVTTFVVTMGALAVAWAARPIPVGPVLVALTVWGGSAFWCSPAIQARLHALAGPVATQALALNTSGTYLGVAAGGALGGIALTRTGAGALPVLAAVLGVLSLLLLAVAVRSGRAATPTPG